MFIMSCATEQTAPAPPVALNISFFFLMVKSGLCHSTGIVWVQNRSDVATDKMGFFL